MKKRTKGKRWRAVVDRKDDVLVVKIAQLLREADHWFERRDIVRKAFAFIGEARPKDWES